MWPENHAIQRGLTCGTRKQVARTTVAYTGQLRRGVQRSGQRRCVLTLSRRVRHHHRVALHAHCHSSALTTCCTSASVEKGSWCSTLRTCAVPPFSGGTIRSLLAPLSPTSGCYREHQLVGCACASYVPSLRLCINTGSLVVQIQAEPRAHPAKYALASGSIKQTSKEVRQLNSSS